MSIEKLTDASQTFLESNPFTQICNKVIEHIKDNDAFRLYVFLAMKTRNWTVVKEWTAQKCGIGKRKAKQCWSYLERCGLIEYIRKRNENGTFNEFDIRVLNGSKFNPHEPFFKAINLSSNDTTGAETAPLEKLSTEMPHQWCRNPPGGETTRAEMYPLLNKDITNKDFETKERKSFCASAQKKRKSKSDYRTDNAKRHDFADSKDQLANESRHIEQHQLIKRSPMPENIRDMIKDLRRQVGRG